MLNKKYFIILVLLLSYSCQQQDQSVDVNLGREYSVNGSVTYPDLTGISQVKIEITADGISKIDFSDALGKFQITGLNTGTYRIKAYLDDNHTIWDANLDIGQNDRNYSIILGKTKLSVIKYLDSQSRYFGLLEDAHIGNNISIIKRVYAYVYMSGYYSSPIEIYKIPLNYTWYDKQFPFEDAKQKISIDNWTLLGTYNPLSSATQNINKEIILNSPNGIFAINRRPDGIIVEQNIIATLLSINGGAMGWIPGVYVEYQIQ